MDSVERPSGDLPELADIVVQAMQASGTVRVGLVSEPEDEELAKVVDTTMSLTLTDPPRADDHRRPLGGTSVNCAHRHRR